MRLGLSTAALPLALVLALTPPAIACTAFLICGNGEVLYGNNEDFWDPNTRIWFVPAEGEAELGYVAVGYDNMFPQGGMNTAGLAFDGFATAARPMHKQAGKLEYEGDGLIADVMKTCSTVEEVVNMLEPFDLSWLENAMLQFADATGDSVIIEGDEFVRGNGRYQVCTNFYQSSVDDRRAACPRFDAASEILGNADMVSVDLCLEALAATAQQNVAQTLYSNVFDLKRGVIHLYNFHNFQRAVVLNLEEELQQGERVLVIADLFPPTFGYTSYLRARQAEMDVKRNEMRGKPVDAKTLDSYAGTYRMDGGATGPIEIKVRREGRKLLAATNGEDEIELTPRGAAEFFVINDQGTQFIEFTRDASGKVTSMSTRMPDLGWEFEAKRVGDG
jgi:hypothetical protein